MVEPEMTKNTMPPCSITVATARLMITPILFVFLAACTSPTTQAEPHIEPPAVSTSATVEPLASKNEPGTLAQAPVDATQLPRDVQDFILNQRMCRHFSRPAEQGGNATIAELMCGKADDVTWKALIRKYQDDDTIGSVLLAERPSGSKVE